ncbi:hypothetical protein, partial [Helicobacter pylori]|uniref:hypothetical protein n=1 Tax=Helicobacter pylori TaxID=210 RepID=UPI003465373D
YLTIFYESFYAIFVWGENLELLGFLVVAGGYLKKGLGVLSLLGVSCKNLIQTGFGRERLKG